MILVLGKEVKFYSWDWRRWVVFSELIWLWNEDYAEKCEWLVHFVKDLLETILINVGILLLLIQ